MTFHTRTSPLYKLNDLDLRNKYDDTNILTCEICAKAIKYKLPFAHSSIHTNKCFHLIHIEIWGPYPVKTCNKHKYFLIIVDDFSRTTWTHLLGCKGNAFDFIRYFIAMVETQFSTKVKSVRIDNALKLGLSNAATAFFYSKGIIHQTSCIYNPQQNGVVERKHKHLIKTSRALLFQSNLPVQYWGIESLPPLT